VPPDADDRREQSRGGPSGMLAIKSYSDNQVSL
jgi:hypothetical protein